MSAVLTPTAAPSRSTSPITIAPLGDVLGAEVIGLDLSRPLADEDFARIHRAHLDHHVLVFRDQHITPGQQVDFSRRFGPLQIHVLIHSVLWPLALNTYAGFQAVPETLRMAGRNYGLRGVPYVLQILVPAALPSILSGLKIGWAFAWRTLIAAELVFGASSGRGGLGWYIFQNSNELYTDKVFAGLAMVIAIGLLVENLGFHSLERVTVRRWGVQR